VELELGSRAGAKKGRSRGGTRGRKITFPKRRGFLPYVAMALLKGGVPAKGALEGGQTTEGTALK